MQNNLKTQSQEDFDIQKQLGSLFGKYNITLSQDQNTQFEKYFQYLIQENQKFNLTAITEPKQVAIKHFLDSVLPIKNFKSNSKIIDVGSGAGFPAIPIKILRPDLDIVMLDSLKKRVDFLNNLISLLNLSKIRAVHSRCEDFAISNREKYDYAISRAVAPMPTLCEYLLPLVKLNGYAVMYKGQKAKEELSLSHKAIATLGGKIEKVEDYILEEESLRHIVFIKKIHPTDRKYPRGKNLPKSQPIL